MNTQNRVQAEDGPADRHFDDAFGALRASDRAQVQRFLNHIIEHEPNLASAITEETKRFAGVQQTVIEPVIREVSDLAIKLGHHVLVVVDDAYDRPGLLMTPGIRFYCDNLPLQAPVNDLIRSAPFIAFHGCAETHTLSIHVRNLAEEMVTPSDSGASFVEYADITEELVRGYLWRFVASISSDGLNVTSA